MAADALRPAVPAADQPRPRRLLATVALSVFVGEFAIMILLGYLAPRIDPRIEAAIDSTVITGIAFVALYLFFFRPLVRQMAARERSEAALRTAEEQHREEMATLSSVVEQTADSVVVSDTNGTIEYVNPAFVRQTGYTREEAVGQNTRLLKSGRHEPSLYQRLWTTILAGKPFRTEFINRKKNGDLYYEEKTITPMRDDGGRVVHFVATAKDVTERKLAEQQLERRVQQLSALRQVDLAIAGSLDLRVVLKVLLDHAVRQLGVDAGAISLMNPATQALEPVVGEGFRSGQGWRRTLKPGQGCTDPAVRERRIVRTLHPEGAPSACPLLPRGEGFLACLAAPLLAKGQVTGLIELFERKQAQHPPDWMEFLEAFTSQAAIAIDNATLFDDLQRSHSEVVSAYDATLEGWVKALDLRDRETVGHTQRVTEMTLRLAQALHLAPAERVHIRRGALLHDIGKIGIPDAILRKPGPLTPEEWEVMRRHPVYAFEMLSPISYLRSAVDIPYCHHEKWDGTGYPRGLKGEQIALAARMFALADVWDALTSDRPYHAAWPVEKVRGLIREGAGKHFDPSLVEVFLADGWTSPEPGERGGYSPSGPISTVTS